MYPENLTNTPLFIHAMDSHGLSNIPDNYLLVTVKIGGRLSKALIDTGAQPTVIKLSHVPIGTPIIKQELSLKGVKGPSINVCGTADIPIEVGNCVFTQNCVVVEDSQIDFPAHSDLIMGANFIVLNNLDISSSHWALLKEGNILQHFEPAQVDGKLFSKADMDYAQGSNFYNPESEVEYDMEEETAISRSSSDRGQNNRNHIVGRAPNNLNKFYPYESLKDVNSQNFAKGSKRRLTNPKHPSTLEEDCSPEEYSIAAVAYREVPAKQLTLVDINITDGEGLSAPIESLYKLHGGIIAPGVILLEGVTTPVNAVAIMNFNNESFILDKGIPFSSASKVETEQVLEVNSISSDCSFDKPEVYTLMALSSITEEAYITNAEYNSEPDNLEDAMRYDPSEISTEEVKYDKNRFHKLLSYINAEDWKLTREQRKAAYKVLFRMQRAFNLPNEALPKTHLIEHDIQLVDQDKAVFVKPRWTPIHQRPHIEKEVKGLLKHELAKTTDSKHSSPVVLVKKKAHGKYRLAVDYRVLNKHTVPLYFPINHIEEVVMRVANSRVHSTVDLRQGFHQVGMTVRSQPITAFSCHLGHFMMTRMPFGLVNAPHTMNRLMSQVFEEVTDFVAHFFDDVFVHSDTIEEHIGHLEAALGKLVDANLQASAEKCKFFTSEVSVLGHVAGQGHIKPGLDKMEAIRDFPVPKTRTKVRGFLGLTGFFRKFVRNYAFISKPLTLLTSEVVPFEWKQAQQEAFDLLKKHLLSDPILRSPDFGRAWFLLTDACDIGIGAWIAQRYDGQLHPVAFFSRQLKKNELGLKRDAMELECLAVIEGLKKFRPIIWGQKIIILSDNSALTWLFSKSNYKSARLTRWALAVQGFNVDILHYPGVLNRVSDALSRNPVVEVNEDMESKATSILEACDNLNISLIGVFPKVKPPRQQEVIRRINSLRSNEQDIEETDIDQAWTIEELLKEQGKDILLKPVIEFINQPTEINRMKVDPNIKNLEDYFIDNSGILFVRLNDKKAELRESEELVVIPHSLQQIAISIIHNTVIGGHAAAERTLFAVRRRFFWRHMYAAIKKFCDGCKTCQVNKGRAHPKQMLRKFPVPDKCFETVSTDLIGPLPVTSNGNRYILVITCFLSRYCVVKALPDKSANVVAHGLWEVFCEHCCPSILYSDSGAEFRNSVLKEMVHNFRVRHVRVAVQHPASNGLTERKNSAILMALKCFMHLNDWDRCLPTAQLATNAAYCSSIGDSPFFVYRGKDPELPYTRFTKPKFSYAETLNFEQERQRREHFVMERVKEKLLEAADKTCRQKAKHCKNKTLRVDDRVFCRRIQKKGESKLIPKWQGPYRILSQKNPNVYKLRDLRTGKTTEQHIENIKEKVIMTRESEIPLEECPEARLPFTKDVETDLLPKSHRKHIPEGSVGDDYEDTSYHLDTPDNYDQNMVPTAPAAKLVTQKCRKKAKRTTQEDKSRSQNQPRRSARLKACGL